jgi:hypothetical protein
LGLSYLSLWNLSNLMVDNDLLITYKCPKNENSQNYFVGGPQDEINKLFQFILKANTFGLKNQDITMISYSIKHIISVWGAHNGIGSQTDTHKDIRTHTRIYGHTQGYTDTHK